MARVHDLINTTQTLVCKYRADLGWVERYDTVSENKSVLLSRADELEQTYNDLAVDNAAIDVETLRHYGDALLYVLRQSIQQYALELQQLLIQRSL